MRHVLAAAILASISTSAAAGGIPNCTFDRVTVGVTPCGADHPNTAPTGAPRPPGDPVYWNNGVQATQCSSVPMTLTFPGQAPRLSRVIRCSD